MDKYMKGGHSLVPANFRSELSSILSAPGLILILLGLSLLLTFVLLDKADLPYIQNLPSVPGVPIFGNLFQLGSEHPRRLAALSKHHGPVFQMRLGNRVRQYSPCQGFAEY